MHVHLPVALCGFDVVRIRCGGVGIVNGVILIVKKKKDLNTDTAAALVQL
jgi:hypothetical protein